MLDKLLFVLFAHFIGDSALQPERHAENKGKVLRFMITHVFIYSGVVCVMLRALHWYNFNRAIYLIIGHFAIDSLLSRTKDIKKTGWIGWLDQAAHLLHLGGMVWIK